MGTGSHRCPSAACAWGHASQPGYGPRSGPSPEIHRELCFHFALPRTARPAPAASGRSGAPCPRCRPPERPPRGAPTAEPSATPSQARGAENPRRGPAGRGRQRRGPAQRLDPQGPRRCRPPPPELGLLPASPPVCPEAALRFVPVSAHRELAQNARGVAQRKRRNLDTPPPPAPGPVRAEPRARGSF